MLRPIAVSTKTRASAGELPHTFKNLFGDGFPGTYSGVYSLHHDLRMNKEDRDISKNHNFFTSEGKLWMEVWPSRERVVVSLVSCHEASYSIDDVHITDYVPTSSNLADEQLTTNRPFIFGCDRGSACCLHLAKSMYHDLTMTKRFFLSIMYFWAPVTLNRSDECPQLPTTPRLPTCLGSTFSLPNHPFSYLLSQACFVLDLDTWTKAAIVTGI
jgi:hypothetical protein